MSHERTGKGGGSDAANAHINELIEDGKVVYRVFTVLAELDADEAQTERVRTALGGIADELVKANMARSSRIRKTVKALLSDRQEDTARLLEGLCDCIRAVGPDRNLIDSVMTDFPDWIQGIPSGCLAAYLDFLDELLERRKAAGIEAVPSVKGFVTRSGDPAQISRYVTFLERYLPYIPPKHIEKLCALAAFCSDGDERAERFERLCPASAVRRDLEAEDLVVHTGNALNTLPAKLRTEAFELFLTTAEQALASAEFVARDLPRRIDALPSEVRRAYVNAYARIVEAVGITAVGFCSKYLSRLFAEQPKEAVLEFVEKACDIARQYGGRAAEDFLERNSATARAAWPGGA